VSLSLQLIDEVDLSEHCVQYDASARSVRRFVLRAGIACSGLRAE